MIRLSRKGVISSLGLSECLMSYFFRLGKAIDFRCHSLLPDWDDSVAGNWNLNSPIQLIGSVLTSNISWITSVSDCNYTPSLLSGGTECDVPVVCCDCPRVTFSCWLWCGSELAWMIQKEEPVNYAFILVINIRPVNYCVIAVVACLVVSALFWIKIELTTWSW